MTSGLAWYLFGHRGWKEKVGSSARELAEEGERHTMSELQDALNAVHTLRVQAGEFFSRYDLLLCPAAAALAWPADQVFPPEIDCKPVGPRGHAVFTAWMNVAGVPAVTVPLRMTPNEGGIGAQLVAGHRRDRALLNFLQVSTVFRKFPKATLAAKEVR